MLELILKQFIKDHKNTGNPAVRTRYVMVGSVAGIIVHMLMFAVKLTAGLLSNSLTIIADSFMGLSDSLSSVFSIIGARIGDKPANAKRPFGYGRVEYMTAVVIAALILFFGLSLLQSAVKRMFTPEDMEFSILVLAIMLLSICARALLGLFHHSLGKTSKFIHIASCSPGCERRLPHHLPQRYFNAGFQIHRAKSGRIFECGGFYIHNLYGN